MGGSLTWILVATATIAGCRPVIEHRNFLPDAPTWTVQPPGEERFLAARHVVPPNAVDDRSAVLVYSTGGRVMEMWGPANSAEIIVKFRARNDETQPLVMEPQNVLLVLGSHSIQPTVVKPDWVEVDDPDRYRADGSIVVNPGATAKWQLEFVLSGSKDPLRRVRSFLLSWTYRVGEETFEERTRFIATEG